MTTEAFRQLDIRLCERVKTFKGSKDEIEDHIFNLFKEGQLDGTQGAILYRKLMAMYEEFHVF